MRFGFSCIVFTMFSIQRILVFICVQMHSYAKTDTMRPRKKHPEINRQRVSKFEHVEFGVDNELWYLSVVW